MLAIAAVALALLLLAVASVAAIRLRTKLAEETRWRSAAVGALQESQDRFQEFTDSAADWLWEIDADYRFTMDTGRTPRGAVRRPGPQGGLPIPLAAPDRLRRRADERGGTAPGAREAHS